jgi:electron transport complex protein RnfG
MAEKVNSEAEKENRFQNNYILQAWLCISLALFFGISLAVVQAALGPVIAANKINETKEKVPEILLGKEAAAEMVVAKSTFQITPRTVAVEKNGITKNYSVFETRQEEDGRLVGWVTKVSGQGYADRIELLLGLDPSIETITGLFVLDQKETPGLGNKIVEEKWRNQFARKSTQAPLKVVKGGATLSNEIDAVTGATISSDSVVSIINKTITDLKQPLNQAERSKKE